MESLYMWICVSYRLGVWFNDVYVCAYNTHIYLEDINGDMSASYRLEVSFDDLLGARVGARVQALMQQPKLQDHTKHDQDTQEKGSVSVCERHTIKRHMRQAKRQDHTAGEHDTKRA